MSVPVNFVPWMGRVIEAYSSKDGKSTTVRREYCTEYVSRYHVDYYWLEPNGELYAAMHAKSLGTEPRRPSKDVARLCVVRLDKKGGFTSGN